MTLTRLQRSAIRLFRGPADRIVSPQLAATVTRARLGYRPEVVVATSLLYSVLTLAIMAVVMILLGFVLLPALGISPSPPVVLLLVLTPVLVTAIVFALLYSAPSGRASARAKSIDVNLPYALSYLSSMTSAGVPVHRVFLSLAGQPIYGQLAQEARAVAKDITLGIDTITALRRAADRSPSGPWSEVLQGAIATTTSGGDLSAYFTQKAQRYAFENKELMKQLVEVMGLMSETYVTVAVASPLFLIIMGTIMSMLGTGEPGLLLPLVYLGIPGINLGFAFVLKVSMPEV